MRFFFHLFNQLDVADEEGAELPDIEAAKVLGLRYARDMAAASVIGGTLNLGHRIEIANEQGQVLGKVTFGDAVEVVGA